MSKISELIDKQTKELTENIPDVFYNEEGVPPEDEDDRKTYSSKTIREIYTNRLGNSYKASEIELELKDTQIRLEMYQRMDIPREWFKTESGYYRFKALVRDLIKDCKDFIKDYEDLKISLVQEENNV